MSKQKAGYVIAGAYMNFSSYEYIVWCANGRWVDLKPGKGKIFKSWVHAHNKAAKLGLLVYQTAILHTTEVPFYSKDEKS